MVKAIPLLRQTMVEQAAAQESRAAPLTSISIGTDIALEIRVIQHVEASPRSSPLAFLQMRTGVRGTVTCHKSVARGRHFFQSRRH